MLKMLESVVNMVAEYDSVSKLKLTYVMHIGCYESSIRLVNGNTRLEGRVEICRNGTWGTVCYNTWNSYDARVVCRQLGLSAAGTKYKLWSKGNIFT